MKTSAEIQFRTAAWANARGHWRAQSGRKKSEREAAFAIWSMLSRPRRELLDAKNTTLLFVRYSPRVLDDDNLPTAFKYIRDELVRLMGYVDDSHRCGLTFAYDQVKRKNYGVKVQLVFKQPDLF